MYQFLSTLNCKRNFLNFNGKSQGGHGGFPLVQNYISTFLKTCSNNMRVTIKVLAPFDNKLFIPPRAVRTTGTTAGCAWTWERTQPSSATPRHALPRWWASRAPPSSRPRLPSWDCQPIRCVKTQAPPSSLKLRLPISEVRGGAEKIFFFSGIYREYLLKFIKEEYLFKYLI